MHATAWLPTWTQHSFWPVCACVYVCVCVPTPAQVSMHAQEWRKSPPNQQLDGLLLCCVGVELLRRFVKTFRMQACTKACTLNTQSHTRIYTHINTHANTHKRLHTRSHKCSFTHNHTHMLFYTITHTNRTHTHEHTQPVTQTQTFKFSACCHISSALCTWPLCSARCAAACALRRRPCSRSASMR
jgi:hypothetical protein